jgi:hypothetical protein
MYLAGDILTLSEVVGDLASAAPLLADVIGDLDSKIESPVLVFVLDLYLAQVSFLTV